MRWLLYIKIVCGNKKNLVLTHVNFYIFVFLVLKGDVVEMDKKNVEEGGMESSLQKEIYSNESAYLENKNLLGRFSEAFDDRKTRDSSIKTSTVYELKFNSKNVEKVLDLVKKCRSSAVQRLSLVNKNNEENILNQKNDSGNNIQEEENINKGEDNRNLVLSIEVDQKDAEQFNNDFNIKKVDVGLNNLSLETTQKLCTVDLGGDKKNAEVELTETDKKIINKLRREKYWILNMLTVNEQIDIIDKLVKLGKEDYKKQQKKIFGVVKPEEYRFFLDSVFNSNRLTWPALEKLNNFLHPREILSMDIIEESKSIWKNIFTQLDDRDISGKRDRMKVMIGPKFQAEIIGGYIKLAKHLRENGYFNNDHDEKKKEKFYNYIIKNAERGYSKLNKEFWSSFLLYLVGLSFIVTLAGAIVTALLSLAGFASLAPFAVLLVSTLIVTGSKFYENYKMWPWDWVYWWKDARDKCLGSLKSEYMKEILLTGTTGTLNGQLPKNSQFAQQIEQIKDKDRIGQEFKKLGTDQEKKGAKDRRKRYGFLFWLSLVVFVAAVLTFIFPSVVAKAISLVLTVFKLELTFTIPAIVSSIAFWVGIVALVAAVVFYIKYKNNRNAYLQKKFDLYRAYFPSQNNQHFMRLKGTKKMWHTRQELNKAGIKVEDEPDIN